MSTRDPHGGPAPERPEDPSAHDGPTPPGARGPSPGEAARGLVAAARTATLSTLTAAGEPWGSLVSFATLADGAPVLCLSTLAEHGRNLRGDGRASLLVAEAIAGDADPLEAGRVTLAGVARVPEGVAAVVARDALLAAHPSAARYVDWEDFVLWVLHVNRVRWIGGFARMDWLDGAAYRDARQPRGAALAPGGG